MLQVHAITRRKKKNTEPTVNGQVQTVGYDLNRINESNITFVWSDGSREMVVK